MTEVSERFLRLLLYRRLAALTSDADELESRAQQIVVFGSRAVGVSRPTSDWDVLFIMQSGPRLASKALDFIHMDPDEASSDLWVGSELAVHLRAIWRLFKGRWRLAPAGKNQ